MNFEFINFEFLFKMKCFSFKRFINVARWDLSVNSKFYTRSAIMMMAFISTPIVLFYLYSSRQATCSIICSQSKGVSANSPCLPQTWSASFGMQSSS